MRSLGELAGHLAGGATTLCHCWRLERRDGQVMGFTDHDEALSFAGTAYEPEAGFEASEIATRLGLGVDTLDVSGALASDRLSGADLEAGLYDDAAVEIWRVNWQRPEERVKVAAGSIGEVRRADGAFTAEIRGLTHRLDQERGRVFQFGCDAELGDGRCRVATDATAFMAEAMVAEVTGGRAFRAEGIEGRADGWFTHGRLAWTGGANAGLSAEVRAHRAADGVIELWQAPLRPIATGDAFRVVAGCDKQFETCRGKFANQLNFRGFPHMPGNDFAISYIAARGASVQVSGRKSHV